jgi:hypothetical protein
MGLDKWASARDGSKELAKAKLAKMPVSETNKGVKVPFPFADKAAYKDRFSNSEINAAIESAPHRDVPLDQLHSIQHSVKPERVAQYIDHPDAVPEGAEHPTAKTPIDEPVVVKYGGKLFLHDGHHRSAAALLTGKKSIRARLVDLDSDEKV